MATSLSSTKEAQPEQKKAFTPLPASERTAPRFRRAFQPGPVGRRETIGSILSNLLPMRKPPARAVPAKRSLVFQGGSSWDEALGNYVEGNVDYRHYDTDPSTGTCGGEISAKGSPVTVGNGYRESGVTSYWQANPGMYIATVNYSVGGMWHASAVLGAAYSKVTLKGALTVLGWDPNGSPLPFFLGAGSDEHYLDAIAAGTVNSISESCSTSVYSPPYWSVVTPFFVPSPMTVQFMASFIQPAVASAILGIYAEAGTESNASFFNLTVNDA
jgi:hypothetical protein